MERFAIKIDKSLRANLYKICRLCGIDNPDKVKVLDEANIVNLEDGEPELWKKVFDCIGLMITKDDKMPQFMCTLCVDKINDFFEFREMCYATDGQTRKLLGIKGEPKAKVQPTAPSSSFDCKIEDIKEPIPEIIPQRASRKRRNADLDIIKDIKLDITDDIKPSTTNIASTSATKKKRIKLSSTTETETKIEPGSKPGLAKKEPTTKITPKAEPPAKIALSKKRLKTESPVAVKENKKEIKATKLTKLMKKKLKVELAPVVVPEPQQPTKKKKIELIKVKKLPQLVVKAEKLKKSMLDTKIKEENPIVPPNPSPAPAPSSKTKPKAPYNCTICSEGFVNKIYLDKHVKTTHIPTVQRYHCVHCNETLKKNMEIKNHNLWHKLSKTPFQCGKCSENSCSIYTYTKHIRDCNPVSYLDSHIPDWHCPDCSGNYETTYLFNTHACVSKGLVCPGCEKTLKWKEDYFKHIPTCSEAFQRIPPYMTSNIQVKNEAELPTSPIPPLSTPLALPTTTITSVAVQSTPSTRITPPQMDSNQCVVIPGNISLHEEAGSVSPSKGSRKGKRITKKDLKRFDKLLKSTMTTLVSIKHEPPQGEDAAVADGEQPSSSEVKDQSERPPPYSPPGSPMPGGGDDFHHNADDSDSADEQTPSKPVGTIKQEIIDEGYRDLYNNIEVNIKHEIEANKNTTEESPHKKTAEALTVIEELTPKPILKLKITKEHGTLNSILMDSPKSEKKKKKKKRKEDRNKSPEKEVQSVADDTVVPTTSDVVVENEVPVEKDVAVEIKVPINQLNSPLAPKAVVSKSVEDPPMPLPEIIKIKKEINVPEIDVAEVEEPFSQNTPSIVAASSGSLQISCVSEGVIFHRADEAQEEMPHETLYSAMEKTNKTAEESDNWAEPIPSIELSLSSKEFTSPSLDVASSMQYAVTQEAEEEIDIKPRLEDLIPMLQIASVTSGTEVIEKPIKKPVKRKRRSTVARSDPIPKIFSVSSGNEVAPYHPPESEAKGVENNEDVFDFSQIKIKEEIVDPAYDEESSITALQEAEEEQDAEEDEAEAEEDDAEDEAEAEEDEIEAEEDEAEAEEDEVEAEENEDEAASGEDIQIDPLMSKKQAEENAYIANIDFNNLTIKQEKEYIDDGLENSVAYEEGEEDDEEDECSDNDSDEVSSDEDSNNSDSESEREYRELPSEDDENDKNDEKLPAVPQIAPIVTVKEIEEHKSEHRKLPTQNDEHQSIALQMRPISVDKENETPTSHTPLELQIVTVHSDFSCPKSTNKKTESEEINSDDKLSLTSTTERNTDGKKKLELDDSQSRINTDIAVPMEVDGECHPALEVTTNNDTNMQVFDQNKPVLENIVIDRKSVESVDKNESIFENKIDERSVQMSEKGIEKAVHETSIVDGNSLQLTQTASVHVEENTDIEMNCPEILDQASISQTNNLDHREKAPEENSMHVSKANLESLKSADNFNETSSNSFETNLVEKTDLARVCDDLESKANEQIVHNRYYNERQIMSSEDISTPVPSQGVNLETNMAIDLGQGLYPPVLNIDPANRLLPPVVIKSVETPEPTSASEPLDVDMVSIDQCYNAQMDSIRVEALGEATEQYDTGRQQTEFKEITPLVTNDDGTLPTLTDNSEFELTSQSPIQDISLPVLINTNDSCQTLAVENVCEPQPPANDGQQNLSSITGSHLPDTHNSDLRYSMHDHNSYKEENQQIEQPSQLENTLETNSSFTQNQASDAFGNTNILMDLRNTVGNSISNTNLSPNHDRLEFNSNAQTPNEVVYNIPQSQMEFQQFNAPGSSYAAFNCNSNPLSFTDYQDLTPPTAGQLQTSLVQQPVVNQSNELSSNSLTNLSVLSEEVQNLLNEDTVAVNNFEFNDSVLRARSSAVAAINPVPIFNDFENLNEIAENNNNANIERELQDELGNVLADAIADRSNDDDVDDNNVMNENRANFDIT